MAETVGEWSGFDPILTVIELDQEGNIEISKARQNMVTLSKFRITTHN